MWSVSNKLYALRNWRSQEKDTTSKPYDYATGTFIKSYISKYYSILIKIIKIVTNFNFYTVVFVYNT